MITRLQRHTLEERTDPMILSVGIAHEFAHVILFLRGLPHSHSQNGGFIYNRQFNVMKRLGYDYVDR